MCICFFIRLYTMYTLTWALVQVAWQGSIQNVHLYAMYSLTRDFQSWARDNFKASRQPQCDNVIEPPEPEKNRKQFRSAWCLDGVATPNKVMLQYQTTLWPENMDNLSQQYCRVPSSGFMLPQTWSKKYSEWRTITNNPPAPPGGGCSKGIAKPNPCTGGTIFSLHPQLQFLWDTKFVIFHKKYSRKTTELFPHTFLVVSLIKYNFLKSTGRYL